MNVKFRIYDEYYWWNSSESKNLAYIEFTMSNKEIKGILIDWLDKGEYENDSLEIRWEFYSEDSNCMDAETILRQGDFSYYPRRNKK